jgi:hypothetical protein
MIYTNPTYYQVYITPNLVNMATEGSLDTSIHNGVSLQRTANMIMTVDCQDNIKMIGQKKDGESYDNIVNYVNGWTTTTNTLWLYPVSYVNDSISELEIIVEKDKKTIIFEDMTSLYSFYTDIVDRTIEAQPIGNAGYSLGVGTKVRDLGVTINLVLESGLKVVTWRLVEQLTSQNDLPVGGDSPDGTIGFMAVYSDWNNDGEQDPTSLSPADAGYPDGDAAYVESY